MRHVKFGVWVLVLSTGLGRVGISAERSRVVTKDGKTYEGEVTKGDEEIVIDQNGIMLRIKSTQVASITVLKPPRADYKERVAKLDGKDVRGHYELALWCRSNGLDDLVVLECETVLRVDRDHAQAKLLLRLAKRRLQAKNKPREPRPDPSSAGDDATGAAPEAAPDTGLISADDVQKIRFAELILPDPEDEDLDPDKVPVLFKNRVLQKFWDEMQGKEGFQTKDRRKFFRMNAMDQLGTIVRETERRYQPDIEIRGEPSVVQTFKTRVWPIVRANCATSNCHSGPNAVKFRLYTAAAGGTQQLYTNFLILSTVSGKDGRIIDRDRVEESSLLSYGLPEKETDRPHPSKVKPIFRNKEDSKYKRFEDWIYLLVRDPGYGVKVPGLTGGDIDEKEASKEAEK